MSRFNGMPSKDRAMFYGYLITHEEDIANCVNDFSDLLPVFKLVVGREPEKDAIEGRAKRLVNG